MLASHANSSSSAFFSRLGISPSLSSYFLQAKFTKTNCLTSCSCVQLSCFCQQAQGVPFSIRAAEAKLGTSHWMFPKLALLSQHLAGRIPSIESSPNFTADWSTLEYTQLKTFGCHAVPCNLFMHLTLAACLSTKRTHRSLEPISYLCHAAHQGSD